MSKILNKRGFTLIELVIVLAIVALILLGVLLAVSGAQKSRRDTQRKDDMGKIVSYLEQSASNHQGDYPTIGNGGTIATFNTDYLASSTLKDPSSGITYALKTSGAPTYTAADPVLTIGSDCGGSGLGNRIYKVEYQLENTSSLYCVSNH